jgi:hypothetical protein
MVLEVKPMKTILSIVSVMVITLALIALNLVSCGGGGGGGDVENDQPPPPAGSGTGSNGVIVFWYPFDTNIAFGQGNAVQETSDHGFVVAGFQADFQQNYSATPHDVFLMKTDSKGTVAWKKRFAWTGGAEAKAVRQTSDGGFIVTGQTITTNNYHRVYLLKTDAAGNAEAGWPKIFGSSNSVGEAVLELSDGYMIVGTRYVNAQDYEDVYVIRTDTAGNITWENYYHSFSRGVGDLGRSIAVTPDNNYVITGATGYLGWKAFLLKIDGQGNELWSKVYGSSLDNAEAAYSVAAAPDGFVLVGTHRAVSGQPPVVGAADMLVIKTDVNGNELWRRTYGGADQDEAFSVAIDQNNDYVVFGYTQSYGGTVDQAALWQYQDLYLIKVDSSGNTIWQKVKGNRPTTSDFGNAICAVSDGGFAVSGSSDGNVLLAKFDGNGDTINLGATDLTITVPSAMGTLNFNNAVDVAAAGAQAIMGPRQMGATAVDLLIAKLKGDPASNFCTGGGSYAFTPSPAVPLDGNAFTLTFDYCVTGPVGDTATLSGSATITVDSVTGNLATTDFTIQTTLTDISITAAETGTLSSSITGGMHFQRVATASQSSERSESIDTPATKLTFSESNGSMIRTDVVGPFIIRDVVTAAGAYSIGSVSTDSATVDSGLGPLTVSIPQPIQGSSLGAEPASGSFRMTAADGSQLTATITSGVTTLAVDANGDGTVDGTLSTTWEFLY